jgi:hypothetical protein
MSPVPSQPPDPEAGVGSPSRHATLLGLVFKTLFASKPLSETRFCSWVGLALASRADVTSSPG